MKITDPLSLRVKRSNPPIEVRERCQPTGGLLRRFSPRNDRGREVIFELKIMRKDIMFLGIKNGLLAEVWEEICRLALPALGETGEILSGYGGWSPAGRYWGGSRPEWDVVARSQDMSVLLLGEVKWHEGAVSEKVLEKIHAGVPAWFKKTRPLLPDRHGGRRDQSFGVVPARLIRVKRNQPPFPREPARIALSFRPGILLKWRRLPVTSSRSCPRAVAAI